MGVRKAVRWWRAGRTGRTTIVLVAIASVGLCATSAIAPAPAVGATNGWKIESSAYYRSDAVFLDGVSCQSPSWCRAVGGFGESFVTQPAIESWNGRRWQKVENPATEVRYGSLNAISCPTERFCMAVGAIGLPTPLAFRWNGTAWTRVVVPHVDAFQNDLTSVACSSPSWCVAVGVQEGFYRTYALIETWDGHTWHRDPSPPTTTGGTSLEGVSCLSASFCMAVGSSGGPDHEQVTLAEQWNGATWSIDASPSPFSVISALNAVACATPTSCSAVGGGQSDANAFEPQATLAESFDGTTWTTTSMSADGEYAVLYGVWCSVGACTAVGTRWPSGAHPQNRTLVEQEQGASWAVVPSPSDDDHGDQPLNRNELDGVSCDVGDCVAVGSTLVPVVGSNLTRPLVETNG